MNARRIPWLLTLALGLALLASAPPSEATGPGNGGLERGPAAVDPQPVPPADPGALVPPDQTPPPPNSPIVGLNAVLDRLDLILGVIGPQPGSGTVTLEGEAAPLQLVDDLEAARRHTQSALDAFLGTSLALHETVDNVELAVRSLEAAPVRPGSPGEALLDAMSVRLAMVAREIAKDLLGQARDGGVPGRILVRGLAELLTGDQLLAAGDHGDSAGHKPDSNENTGRSNGSANSSLFASSHASTIATCSSRFTPSQP